MKFPPGFRGHQPGTAFRLRKSFYGLRQASRCWFAKLAAALTAYGFQQSASDYSLFTLVQGGDHLAILIYVDDIVIGGNNGVAISRFKSYLQTCFHMKDLGHLKFFLGLEVARNSTGIF